MDLYLENGGIAPRLTTSRLVLRPFTMDDAAAVTTAFQNFDVVKWLTGVPYPYVEADYVWFLEHFIPDTHHVVWAIDAGEGAIGAIGVQPELGYWLAKEYHGRGLMTEAANCVLDWYFARSDADLPSGYIIGNGPSEAVLRKLGFRDTQLREVTTARGDQVTVQRLALTAQDWAAQND